MAASAPAPSAANALTVSCSVLPTHCHKSSPDCSLCLRSPATRVAASAIRPLSSRTQISMKYVCALLWAFCGNPRTSQRRTDSANSALARSRSPHTICVSARKTCADEIGSTGTHQAVSSTRGSAAELIGQRLQQMSAGGGEVAFQPDDGTQR